MRNLKKVLSLTLALVMMLGMMTFAGAAEAKKVTTAADLTDMNDVKNKEAVTLLVDLKIVAGRDTGKFDPKGTLTRAEFAKMIYVAKLGADDKATNFVGAATGLTDTKMWAEGYINYCFSTGIVSGRTATVFDPDGKVLTVEAAKMLLTALGFDAEAQGYINDNLWSVNVMQDAKKAGLMAGVKDASNAPLSRDSAAQMIFNALFAKTITNTRQKDFTGKWYISSTVENKTTLGEEVFGLVKVTGTIDTTGADTTISNAKVGVTATAKYDKSWIGLASAKTDKGYSCSFFVDGNDKLLSSAVALQAAGVYSIPAGLTNNVSVTKDGTVANWLRANGLKYDTITLNGDFGANTVTTYSAGAVSVNAGTPDYITTLASLTAGQTATAIDADNDGVLDILNIFAKNVKIVGADGVTTKVNATSGKTQVKIASVVTTLTDVENVVGYEGLQKDDVVLVYTDGVKTYVEKITPFTAQLTALSSDSEYTIGGKKYEVSTLTGAGVATSDLTVFNKDVQYWLDDSGYIVRAKAVSETSTTNVAFMIEYLGNDSNTVLNPGTAKARLVYTDGTAEVLTVKKTKASLAATSWDAMDGTIDKLGDNIFVAYTKNTDGTVNLAAITATDAEGTKGYDLGVLDDAVLKSGVAKFAPEATTTVKVQTGAGAAAAASIYGNANTIFIVEGGTATARTYTVKTGIANAPAYSGSGKVADGNVLILDGMATVVFLASTSVADANVSNTTYTYMLGTGYTQYPAVVNAAGEETAPAYREFKAIVDGKVTTVKAAATFALPAAGMYDLAYEDGLVKSATFKTPAQGINYAAGVVVSGSNYWTADADSVIYVIEGNTVSEVKAADIAEDADDLVYFVASTTASANKSTTIGKLYIVRGDAFAKLPTMAATAATLTGTELTGCGASSKLDITLKAATDKVKIDGAGSDVAEIAGTDKRSYTVVAGDELKYIVVTVTGAGDSYSIPFYVADFT